MSENLGSIVERFTGLRVAVIGEPMLDSYLLGSSGRLCREAPVPIVDVRDRIDAPGGAANTAANLRALGAEVVMVGAVGEDDDADRVAAALEEAGVALDGLVRAPERRTLSKARVVADGQMMLRFDQGSTEPLATPTEATLIERLAGLARQVDAIVVSDYGYGILTPTVIGALADLQAMAPRVLVVDSKDCTRYRRVGVTAAKPNYDEARRLLGSSFPGTGSATDRGEAMARRGGRLLHLTGARIVAVTLDTEGAVVLEHGSPAYRTYADPAPQSQAAGAGDTFVAGLALALAAGASTTDAAEIASAASAVVVAKNGTSICRADELAQQVAGLGKYIADGGMVAALARRHREAGRRVVFTNGCFDIIHRGHVSYLSRAKALGDVLIVGLNSDASVSRLKGAGRPLNPLEDRGQVLAALSCVDYVVPFEDDTPEALIRAITPDVFAKGGDYTRETLPEVALVESLGGEVQILPYVEDRSTTQLIHRIRGRERTDITLAAGG